MSTTPLPPESFKPQTPETRAALAGVLGVKVAADPILTPPVEAPAPSSNGVASTEEKKAIEQPKAEVATPAAEDADTPPEASVITAPPAPASAIDSLFSTEEPVAALPPEVSPLIEKKYGVKDLDAHFQEHATIKERLTIAENEAAEAKRVIDHINGLSPEMIKAIEEDRKKPGSGAEFLRKTPALDYTKDAKDLDPFALVDARFPGKFSADDIEDLRSSSPDPALKAQFERYHDISVMDQNRDRGSWIAEQEQKEVSARKSTEMWKQSAAEGYAYLQKNAKSLELDLTPEMRKSYESGQIIRDLFLTKEGLLKPDSLQTILTIKNLPKILERAKAGIAKAAYEKGVLEGHQRLPETPRPTTGANTHPPAKTDDPTRKVLERILRSN